ncbi:hypothetical protein ACU8V7_11900 [Zobellia nedashkovskayae]
MLNLLSQIIATILSIGVSFLAAYIIYLFSIKSDAQSKIEEERYIISRTLQKKYHDNPIYPFSNVGRKVLKVYLKKYPKDTKLDLIDRALKDIRDNYKEQIEIDKLFSNSINDKMPYAGRVYVFSLHTYLIGLFPPNGPRGLTFSYIEDKYKDKYDEEEDLSNWLFPYGPIGREEWLKEYRRFKSAVIINKKMLNFYKNDLNGYLQMNQNKKLPQKSDYISWLNEIVLNLDSLDASVAKIYSLQKTIDTYSVNQRLPNLNSIILFFILSFLCGVFFPLLLEGLKMNGSENVVLNLSTLFVTVLFTFLAGYYLSSDLARNKNLIQTKVIQSQLSLNLDFIFISVTKITFVNYADINAVVNGVYKDGIPKGYLEKLKTLTKKLSAHNNSAGKIHTAFKTKIIESEIFSNKIIERGKGGNGVWLSTFLLNDNVEDYFKKNMVWVVEFYDENGDSSKLRIRVPEDDENYNVFIKELKTIKSEMLKFEKDIENINEIFELLNYLNSDLVNIEYSNN